MLKWFILSSIAVIQLSCVTRGNNFSSSTNWIEANKTTRNQMAQTLGEPFMVGKSSGASTWTYGYYQHKLFGSSTTKELKVYWNSDGTVQNYSFNSSFPEDKAVVFGSKGKRNR